MNQSQQPPADAPANGASVVHVVDASAVPVEERVRLQQSVDLLEASAADPKTSADVAVGFRAMAREAKARMAGAPPTPASNVVNDDQKKAIEVVADFLQANIAFAPQPQDGAVAATATATASAPVPTSVVGGPLPVAADATPGVQPAVATSAPVAAPASPPPPTGYVQAAAATPSTTSTVAAPAPVPAAAIQQVPPARPQLPPPPGYLPAPTGKPLWTIECYDGRALHGGLVHAVERPGAVPLLELLLAEPVSVFDRAGRRRIELRPGARVMIHAGYYLQQLIPLAKHDEGYPVVHLRPTREILVDGGGREIEWEIHYQPHPDDPKKPRMVPRDTLRA